jgi:hypothetical protein
MPPSGPGVPQQRRTALSCESALGIALTKSAEVVGGVACELPSASGVASGDPKALPSPPLLLPLLLPPSAPPVLLGKPPESELLELQAAPATPIPTTVAIPAATGQ